ncbi:TetR/AcrR family transcriptional regulator [Roseibium suaedae]|uniref:Transcriptional regulator, TetR family n=1 Tax=Roseibium suaedae TaxID=735517 RepID=A0A1M7CKF1_9HYPH|nr:TetR/AcrR family transcriptional regulator [Roseibium suaedae]SHL67613.1 transcriptional regulator, TetR family [Roseibium suaedae]
MTTRPTQKPAAGSGCGKAHAKAQCGPGRPRGYDEHEVLSAALQVFWRQGYEATSLDDLTGAMGLSRSSFYAAFGSKQGVLIAALKSYSQAALSALRDLSDGPANGPEGTSVRAMLAALADPQGGPRGCLLVNCITELAPHEEEVAAIGRKHLQGVEDLFAAALNRDDPDAARDKARALSALAIGTLTLRKSGLPPEQISKALEAAEGILTS